MDQLPSNSLKFRGFLRSSHALLGLLAIVVAILFGFSLKANFVFGEYLFSILILVFTCVVLYRYQLKGPEADHLQPTLSVTHEDNRVQTQILHYDPAIMAAVQAVLTRRPLPLPAGIIKGPASDPNAIHPIDEQTAIKLQKEDSQLNIPSTGTQAGSPPVVPPSSAPGTNPRQ